MARYRVYVAMTRSIGMLNTIDSSKNITPKHWRTIFVLPMVFAGTILPLYLTYASETRSISRRMMEAANPRLIYFDTTIIETEPMRSLSAIGS